MWIELPNLWIALFNTLGIPIVHLAIAWWSHRRAVSGFDPGSLFFRPQPWETAGVIYRKVFLVPKWKGALPDAASWVSGFAKAKLKSREPEYLRRFIIETCRGEQSHWVQMVAVSAFIIWTPFPYALIILFYAALSNLPCILNLRFTRARLVSVLGAQGMKKGQPIRVASSALVGRIKRMEHHVYFWLKEEFKNETGRARMESALNELVKSPNISKSHWGTPAPTEERPVTDHSWDYGISFHFDTMEAHEKYQKSDPAHDAFSGGNKEMWEKVMVMDLA